MCEQVPKYRLSNHKLERRFVFRTDSIPSYSDIYV